MTAQLLHGLRALDLTTPLGATCGRILASFGVDVVRIDSSVPSDPSALQRFRADNLDKRSLTIDLADETARARFTALVATADFVIESFAPGHLSSLGLDYAALRAINPALILVSISPFGQHGPYASFHGGELVASAMSGVLITLGDADRPPVKEALDANCFHGSAAAALGAVIAHYHRVRTGVGQHVDLSLQEAGVSRNTNNVLLYQFDKRCVQRGGSFLRFGKASIRVIWKLRDGYMFYSMATGRFGAPANRALCSWMDELGYDHPMRDVDWERYDRATLDAQVRKTWEAAIGRFFAARTKAEIDNEGRRRGINAAVANAVADLLNDQQLAAREYFVDVPWDDREVRIPRYFVRSSGEAGVPQALRTIDGDELARDWTALRP